ncbi:MAG: universal stress protein [Rubripirellula sp.]|nr:universal stress protein [Rubripirellula sp.]
MKILLATDGSSNAREAAEFLRNLQISEPFELTILSVCYDPETTGPEVVQPWFPEWLAQQQAAYEKHHRELEALLADRCSSVSRQVREGHAARVILNEAESNQSDLIVMGAQGHSAVGRVVLGSVSDRIATHATCSVLIVHPNPDDKANTSKGSPALAIAYDSSPASCEATAEMTELGLSSETPLTLVSIAPIFDYTLGEGLTTIAVENEEAVYENMNRAIKEACETLRPAFPQVKGIVEKGRHIGDTLVATAEREQCDLLVIGDAEHSLLHDWILGSTTKFVLRHTSCSIWISRHHRRSSAEENH